MKGPGAMVDTSLVKSGICKGNKTYSFPAMEQTPIISSTRL
jgi:hypothetical protein